jgi:hypothetical protein
MIKWILGFALVLACSVDLPAHANNASQTTIDNNDVSSTVASSNTWQRVTTLDSQRAKLMCQNVSTHNMLFYIPRYTNNGATPTPSATVATPAAGTILLFPGGSFSPDGGWIEGGEVWVSGTAGDAFTCWVSRPVTP